MASTSSSPDPTREALRTKLVAARLALSDRLERAAAAAERAARLARRPARKFDRRLLADQG